MLVDHHKNFVECDVDSELLTSTRASLMLEFDLQLIGTQCDISDGGEMNAATKYLKNKRAAVLAIKAGLWQALPGLDATQVLQGLFRNSYQPRSNKYPLYERIRQFPLSMWSLVRRIRLSFEVPKDLLRYYGGLLGVPTRTSTACDE